MLIAILLVLAVAAALAVLVSEMPRISARPLAVAALLYGAWQAWREARRPCSGIMMSAGDAPSTVDGEAVEAMTVSWRGPIAFLRWRAGDGRIGRHVFWPDTLPVTQRRELRLAAPAAVNAHAPASMAP
jgi:toxin CptA